MVRVDRQAPNASLLKTGSSKEQVELAEEIGGRRVVLVFFPFAFSSTCTDEMCAFRNVDEEFNDLGATVYGISVDSPYVLEAFAEQNQIEYQLLSDFNREAITKYGVVEDIGHLKNVAKRSVFVIDADGKITYTWQTDDPAVLPDVSEIREALDSERGSSEGD